MKFSDFERTDDTTASLTDIMECQSSKLLNTEDNETDLKEERFRVDRRKLEQMLQGESVENQEETADSFFHRIMDETNTQISWPSKLKVGAKSKKDPHIKISGQPEAVFMAREKVLEVLDTKRNRVTLKMDVSFTDHSHIIGKGGHNIQQVMEHTGCHIHFPDSNRNNTGEKSNQVSIAGQPHGVEQARCKIRELLPMIITFELPVTGFLQPIPDVSSPTIQLIQQTYSFTVSFRQKQRGSSTAVMVRGCRRQLHTFRQGVFVLMDYLTGSTETVLPVSLSMEIAAQHHSFVMGRNGVNIQVISQKTGATITFPDALQLNNSTVFQPAQSRKSTVVISGLFDSVCLAWQKLMDCLPLVLMFDLKEGQELDPAQVTKLMDHLNINIVIRPKPKQNTKSILVRGCEKSSQVLFEVRRQLLNLDKSEVPVSQSFERHGSTPLSPLNEFENISDSFCKEPSVDLAGDLPTFNQSNTVNMFSGYTGLPQMQSAVNAANYGMNSSLLPWLLTQISLNPANAYNALIQFQLLNCSQQLSDLAMTGMLARTIKDLAQPPSSSDQTSTGSQASTLSSPNVSPCESPVFMSKSDSNSVLSSNSSSSDNACNNNEKAWNSKFWAAENLQPEPASVFLTEKRMLPPQAGRPILAASSSLQKMCDSVALENNNEMVQQKDIGSIGCEKKNGFMNRASAIDYDQKRLLSAKVFEKPVNSKARVPTAAWSGCGFSKSVPQSTFRSQLSNGGSQCGNSLIENKETLAGATYDETWQQSSMYSESDTSKDSFPARAGSLSSSNYFDISRTHLTMGSVKDLPQLLIQLTLEKYIDVFNQQQVDLSAFLTLTEKDLQELGIPYRARQRMLRAISELNSIDSRLTPVRAFQAAPGAERRRPLFSRISQLHQPIAENENSW